MKTIDRSIAIHPMLTFFLLAVVLVTACSKDDDDPMEPTGGDPVELSCGDLDVTRTLTDDPDKPVDYVIRCNMNVSGQLTIEPGVVIAFESGRGLNVTTGGSINAVGTAEKPIVFTGIDKVKGAWAGIMVRSSSPLNKLQFVTVEYGGQTGFWANNVSGNVCTWQGALLELNHCRLNKSLTYGLNVYHLGTSDVTLNNNSYVDNQVPLRINAENIWIPSPTDDYTGNVENKIEVVVYTSSISGDRTWRKINVPYKLTGTQDMNVDGNLTIEPGTRIEMGQNTTIKLGPNGGLKAVGLPGDRIRISGELGVKGSWHHIYIQGSNPINEIGYADIYHSGQDQSNDRGAIMVYFNGRLNIHDVHFEEMSTCGLAYRLLSGQQANPNLTYQNLTFSNVGCEVEEY